MTGRPHLALAALALGAIVATATPAGALPDAGDRESVQLLVVLAPHDATRLDRLAHTTGLPESLRAAELAAVAPRPADLDRVVRWLRTGGLSIGEVTPWSVAATAPRALATSVAGVVPAALSGVVQGVFGLTDDGPLMRPQAVPVGYDGDDLRSAYDAPFGSSAGTGMTIATMQFSGWDNADLIRYANAAGITLSPGQITEVSVAGTNPRTVVGDGDVEVALDQEALLATAPAAKQRIYFGQNGAPGAVATYNAIANEVISQGIDAVSISWGNCEQVFSSNPTARNSLNTALARMVAAGATVFSASGDSGGVACSTATKPNNNVAVLFPASSPYAVGVGGTHLTKSGGWQETAWREPQGDLNNVAQFHGMASGGGESTLYNRPGYQVQLPYTGTKRLVPDVSSLADPHDGIGIAYHGAPTGWMLGGGTSIGAPVWAGFLAAALSTAGRTTGVGAIHQTLYANAASFRDITSGDNFVYAAGPGYDPVTGLGSPQWSDLVDAILAIPAGTFHALTPERVLDTRAPAPGVPVGAGQSVPLVVAGKGGVPASGAAAVVLNVTATAATAATHVTVYPGAGNPPGVSNLNVAKGQTVPNLVTVKLGNGGAVSLANHSGTVHLIADVVGWIGDDSATTGSVFKPLSPARLLDTRAGIGAAKAPLGPGAVLDLNIHGVGGVPTSGIGAVVLNVTATQPTGAGFLTVFPTGASTPTASNVNYVKRQTIANLVWAKVGTGGKVRFFNSAGYVHVVADVVGWFTDGTSSTGARFYPVQPERVLDTRDGTGTGPAGEFKLGENQVLDAALIGTGPIPQEGVTAVVLNVTVTDVTATTYLTVFPSTGAAPPTASNLNADKGKTVPNLVVVKLGSQGRVRFYNAKGTVNLIADVVGFFA